MGRVVSFEAYEPAARFDDVPWEQVRVREGETSTGPWTLIQTLDLDPLDADPANPRLRNLSTTEASDTDGLWYTLSPVDGNGDVGEATTPVQNIPAPTLAVTPYVSLQAFKDWAGIKVATDDFRTEAALAAATAAINSECDRDFHVAAVESERFYTPDRPRTLEIDDAVEIQEFASDLAGNGTFDLIWVENRDFTLQPLNAAAKGRPYERVKIHPWSHFVLSSLPRSVRITGLFGWPAVPDSVIECTLLLTNRLRERKSTPFGIASFGTDVALRLLRTDPDMQLLLNDLSRDPIVY